MIGWRCSHVLAKKKEKKIEESIQFSYNTLPYWNLKSIDFLSVAGFAFGLFFVYGDYPAHRQRSKNGLEFVV